MSNYHVVPRGDAIKHKTQGNDCVCGTEIKTVSSESRGGYDVWIYHREVTIDEAIAKPVAENV